MATPVQGAAAPGQPLNQASQPSQLKAESLKKRYGARTVVHDVHVAVSAGEVVGLLGPNGAGKTTALNAILGLIPYQGELRVLGRDPWTERDQLMRERNRERHEFWRFGAGVAKPIRSGHRG